MSGNFLSCLKGVKTLSGLRMEGGISLKTVQRKSASARVKWRMLWFCRGAAVFLSNYDLALRDPLVGLQGSPISKRVAMGPAGFLCSRCQARGPHLQLRPEPQGSSPGTIWISGFLWTPQGGQALSRVEPCKSALLLSQKRSVWLPVGLTIGIGGFLSRCNRASTPAIVF